MTIRDLINELQALAADSTSGVTLDSSVRVSTEGGDRDVNFAYVWPLGDVPYVTFETEGDSREQVAEVVRRAVADLEADNRERAHLTAALEAVGWDYPSAAAKLGMPMEEFNRATRRLGL